MVGKIAISPLGVPFIYVEAGSGQGGGPGVSSATVDDTSTEVYIPVTSGGMNYVYTQPLTVFSVASVVNTPAEDRFKFTLASSGAVVVDFPASCGICPENFIFEGGKSYKVAIMDGDIHAAPYTPGVDE